MSWNYLGRLRVLSSVLLPLSFLMLTCTPSPARDRDNDEYSLDQPGVSESIDTVNTGTARGQHSLMISAEYCLRSGDYEKAIQLCREAFKKNDDDLDYHVTYASALEEKLRAQKHKDPRLYNEVVKEWLIVFRSERGEEHGMETKDGLMLPFTHLYDDDERQRPAKAHLIALTGRSPHYREKDSAYLAKVQVDTTTHVEGAVVHHNDSDKHVASRRSSDN